MSKVVHTVEDDQKRLIPAIFLGESQSVSIISTNAQSNAVGQNTGLVRLVSTTDCYIKIAVNPTATTSSTFLPAGLVEYFGINPGEKIGVIRSATDGVLNITAAQ